MFPLFKGGYPDLSGREILTPFSHGDFPLKGANRGTQKGQTEEHKRK